MLALELNFGADLRGTEVEFEKMNAIMKSGEHTPQHIKSLLVVVRSP